MESLLFCFEIALIQVGVLLFLSIIAKNPFIICGIKGTLYNVLIMYLLQTIVYIIIYLLGNEPYLFYLLLPMVSVVSFFIVSPLVYVYASGKVERMPELEARVLQFTGIKAKVFLAHNKSINAWAFGASFLNIIIIENNLVEKVSTESVNAILCHEAGHLWHRHVNRFMLISYIYFVLLILGAAYLAPYIPLPRDFAAAVWAGITVSLQMIVIKLFSDRFEFQADRYSGKAVGNSTMQTALNELNEAIDHYLEQWSWTHPRLSERLKNLD